MYPYSFPRILKVVAALLLTLLPVAKAQSVCDHVKEQPNVPEEDYKNDIGPWFRDRYDEWKAANETGSVDTHFWKYFSTKYAPEVAPSMISCNLADKCSDLSCRFVADDIPVDDQVRAYRSLESIVNFHNFKWNAKRFSDEKFDNLETAKESLVQTYSEAHVAKKTAAKQRSHEMLILHIAMGVALIAGAAITGGGAALITGAATSAWVTLSTSGLAVLGSSTLLASNVLQDTASTGDYIADMTTNIGRVQSFNQEFASTIFSADLHLILAGEPGFFNQTIVDVVESGKYGDASKMSLSTESEKRIRDLWAASWISNMWSSDQNYIVWADAPQGCEQDTRGNAKLKVCLETHPNSVFYIYLISKVEEGSMFRFSAYVRGPAGYDRLHEYAPGLTLQDVVRSSVAKYQDHGNNQLWRDHKDEQAFIDFFEPNSALMQEGGNFSSFFSIPVCYMPDGMGISSINLQKSRNYPCMCGTPPQRNTQTAKREASYSSSSSRYPSYDEGLSFLNYSGLYRLGTWNRFCKKRHLYPGQDCEVDKSVDWSGSFPPGKDKHLKHPMKTCDAFDHEKKGCETPHNDGAHQNKNCG